MNVMIDLETMGIRPNAAIVAIGGLFFDERRTYKEFYTPVSLQSCIDHGLSVSQSTVDWWAKQPAETRATWDVPNAPSLLTALTMFCDFVRDVTIKPWGNGVDFDMVVLKSAFEAVGAEPPWKYYNQRDFRTIRDLFPVTGVERTGAHTALGDCKYEVNVLQEICLVHGIKL